MFKNLIATIAVAGVMLLASAAGVSATYEMPHLGSSAHINIANIGSVSNSVSANANTGYNGQNSAKGGIEWSSLTTGAANAGSNVMTQLNWNQFDCGCFLGLSDVHKLNFDLYNNGSVSNSVASSANTGYNSQNANGWSWHHGGNNVEWSSITTGAAGASSVVQNVVNTNKF